MAWGLATVLSPGNFAQINQENEMANEKVKFLEVDTKTSSTGDVLHFTFGNGKKIVFDPSKCSKAIQHAAMLHGFNQKLRDSTAGFSKEVNYEGAMEALTEVMESLLSGSWNRQGGGGQGINLADLAQALAQIKNADLAKAKAAVDKATPEQRKAWSKNAKVQAIMAELVASRAKAQAESVKDDLAIDL